MHDLIFQRELYDVARNERVPSFVRSANSLGRTQRLFSEKDISLLLLNGVFSIASMVVPPARWSELCKYTSLLRLAKYKRRELSQFSEKVTDILGLADPKVISALYKATHRRLHERQMTYVRERFRDHGITTEVVGLDHLNHSLEQGSGAVLWNTPALGDTILTKRALANADVLAYQLSVRSHGFSQSRFGEYFINPPQIGIEDSYLAGRIWFDGDDSLSATREVMRKLKQNLPVLFTNSLVAGRSFLGVPVGSRYLMLLPTTPISIAVKAGVPLHVVTTVERVPFTHYVTSISEALTVDLAVTRQSNDARIAGEALRVRDIVLDQLRIYPDQLRLWDRFVDRDSAIENR